MQGGRLGNGRLALHPAEAHASIPIGYEQSYIYRVNAFVDVVYYAVVVIRIGRTPTRLRHDKSHSLTHPEAGCNAGFHTEKIEYITVAVAATTIQLAPIDALTLNV